MGAFLQILRNLGPMRLTVMGGVIFGLIAFFIYLTTRLAGPQMQLLYGDLEPTDSQRIASQLQAQNIPYEVQQNGRQVLVPADKVGQIRLAMAEKGLPSGGSIGYEIFDKTDALGTTTFVQDINLVRAMEGELARTISAIESVRSARVHLVLPKRQLFSREKQEPSASIVLKMKGPTRLSREQVTSVQHLVAAAVPSLSPQRISIVDDKGNLLARGFEGGPGGIGDTAEEKRLTYETRLARTLEEMLEKTVGFGKVRAEVRAEMDFDRVVTNEEKFDPEGQVVRSTQTVDDRSSSRDGETTPVSVGQNLPDANAETAGGAAASAARTEETVNYEISKRIVNHVRESGIVKRLSVAVLIDGISEPGPDGQRTYRPRGNEEMEQLATLVRGAIGFNSARGDSVEVVNMRFAAVEEAPEPPLDLFFGLNKNDLLRMAEILVLSIVAILVILLVVRPLVTKAFEAMPAAISAAEGRLLAERTAQAALAAPGAGPVPVPTEAPGEEEEGFEELIDIDRVEGRVKASSVKKVGEIVDKHPEEALAIVRNWMYQET